MRQLNSLLVLAALLAVQATKAQQASISQPQSTQAQMQAACLAALPPAPKPPPPAARPLFPGLQQKIDQAIIRAGGDPNAMRAAAQQAAQQKYQAELQAYQQRRNACYAPTPAAAAVTAAQPVTLPKPQ